MYGSSEYDNRHQQFIWENGYSPEQRADEYDYISSVLAQSRTGESERLSVRSERNDEGSSIAGMPIDWYFADVPSKVEKSRYDYLRERYPNSDW